MGKPDGSLDNMDARRRTIGSAILKAHRFKPDDKLRRTLCTDEGFDLIFQAMNAGNGRDCYRKLRSATKPAE